VSEDAGLEPRTVATSALAVRRSNHSTKLIHKTALFLFLSDGENKGKPWAVGFKWPVVVAGAPEAGIPRVSCPQETLSFPPFIQAEGGGGGGGLVFPMGNFPEECVGEHGEYLAACSQQVGGKQSQSLGHLVAGFKSH
jgi:hypothetical protein